MSERNPLRSGQPLTSPLPVLGTGVPVIAEASSGSILIAALPAAAVDQP